MKESQLYWRVKMAKVTIERERPFDRRRHIRPCLATTSSAAWPTDRFHADQEQQGSQDHWTRQQQRQPRLNASYEVVQLGQVQ